jgi:hypothetical protein
MRVVASPEVTALVRASGGRVFVWPLTLEGVHAGTGVFSLEAATESPGAGHEFVRVQAKGFEVLIDASEHGLPDELHLAVKGWRRKRIRAYWNGHSFGRG